MPARIPFDVRERIRADSRVAPGTGPRARRARARGTGPGWEDAAKGHAGGLR
jgi:hypothetical protein